MPVGQWIPGVIARVTSYGCHVEVTPPDGPSASGLVHISNVKDGYVEDLEEEFYIGQDVSVRVVRADVETGKLSLSMLPLSEADEQNVTGFADLPSDMWLKATVVSKLPFGLRAKAVLPGGTSSATGLLHISEIQDGFVKDEVLDTFEVGQEISVRVRDVEHSENRISWRMKEAPEASSSSSSSDQAAVVADDVSSFVGVPGSTWLQGVVMRKLQFGILVNVDPPDGSAPVTGLVHISEIQEGFVSSDLMDSFTEGKEVKVRLLNVDEGANKISLTMKSSEEKADVAAVSKYVGDDSHWFEGTVQHLENYGIHTSVEIDGQFFKGLIHSSQVNAFVPLEPGSKVQVWVSNADAETERINFSMMNRSLWSLEAFQGVSTSEILDGRISAVMEFGCFVSVRHPDGVFLTEGLVTKRTLPEDFRNFRRGQKVQVKLEKLEVDAGKCYLALESGLEPEAEPAAAEAAAAVDEAAPAAAPAAQAAAGAAGVAIAATGASAESLGPTPDDLRKLLKSVHLPLSYADSLEEQGYDSIRLLLSLSKDEWVEMKQACRIRPGDAAKLRLALGRKKG